MSKVITLAGLPSLKGLAPAENEDTAMKVVTYAAVTGLGAGAGYLLFKNKIGTLGSIAAGGAVALVSVMAFAPGGWLRR